jgi:hypothetical protein
MTRVLLILAILAVTCSCKKYRLNGDKEILVGEWEWTRSDIDNLSGGAGSTSVSPTTEDFTASITFAKRNKITLRRDGEITLEDRLKMLVFKKGSSLSQFAGSGEFEVKKDGVVSEFRVDILASNENVVYVHGFPYTNGTLTSVQRNIFHRK